ncbi:hypothetical protein DEF24_27450, partial [Marinitenerispora sediminis]
APVTAEYLLDGETAYLESAQACGLHLVPAAERDPGRTTSRGVGELIAAAVADGARTVVIGLGGSVTNDGGAGMLAALGRRNKVQAARLRALQVGGLAVEQVLRRDGCA